MSETPPPQAPWPDSPDIRLVEAFRTMVRIRLFEEKVEELFLAGKLPGFVHTYIGQEAVATGVCANLSPNDFITSTHRGHGHAIAKGVEIAALMAELYGKATGVCRGRGGSMHVADFSRRMLGANGIVAGGTVIAAGAGLSILYRQTDEVVVTFFGDGGLNKGTVHESMNFAALKKLPVIFVCENNQFAQFTAQEKTTSGSRISDRAKAYGMPGVEVDGNDIAEVAGIASNAVSRARSGQGPTFIVANTYRFGGHYVGDAEPYRERDDVERRRSLDPIPRCEDALTKANLMDEASIATVWAEAAEEIGAAVIFAENSVYPSTDSALDYVFTDIPESR